MNTASINAGQRFAEGEGRHKDRRAITLLVGAFLTDFYALAARWADWATAQVESWPEDVASHRIPPETTRAVLARATWSQSEGDT